MTDPLHPLEAAILQEVPTVQLQGEALCVQPVEVPEQREDVVKFVT